MRLSFQVKKTDQYPHGYWFAETDDGAYDADGENPLEAVTKLALTLELVWNSVKDA